MTRDKTKISKIRAKAKQKRKVEVSEDIKVQHSKIRKLKKLYKNLCSDLDAIEKEHNRYKPANEAEAMIWLESFPIESLRDSLDYENNRPRKKLSLKDVKHRSNLRLLYEHNLDALDKLYSDLNIAQIDLLLMKVKQNDKV